MAVHGIETTIHVGRFRINLKYTLQRPGCSSSTVYDTLATITDTYGEVAVRANKPHTWRRLYTAQMVDADEVKRDFYANNEDFTPVFTEAQLFAQRLSAQEASTRHERAEKLAREKAEVIAKWKAKQQAKGKRSRATNDARHSASQESK